MTKKVNAYFTVEAALVLPVALGVIVLIIYLWFFQYDRCLMEQDAGILALRGAILEADDNQERVQLLEWEARQINKEKYVAWEEKKEDFIIKEGKLQVSKAGEIRFPFRGLQFWNGEDIWGTEAIYKNRILSPTTLIRYYRKLTGGQ